MAGPNFGFKEGNLCYRDLSGITTYKRHIVMIVAWEKKDRKAPMMVDGTDDLGYCYEAFSLHHVASRTEWESEAFRKKWWAKARGWLEDDEEDEDEDDDYDYDYQDDLDHEVKALGHDHGQKALREWIGDLIDGRENEVCCSVDIGGYTDPEGRL